MSQAGVRPGWLEDTSVRDVAAEDSDYWQQRREGVRPDQVVPERLPTQTAEPAPRVIRGHIKKKRR